MLDRTPILVAEDEPYIALDLAFAIEDASGRVIGPAASVREALALLEANPVAGAILDVNLTDGDITPVVEALAARGIPTIVQTGVGTPPEFAARFPALMVHIKPCSSTALVSELESAIRKQ